MGMAREPEPIAKLRRALGQALARQRTGRLTQNDLAVSTNYSRTSIAHIEAGRQSAPRAFWAAADQACDAQGTLLASYDATKQAEARWQLEQLHEDDDVNRRAMLALMAGAASTPFSDHLEQARRGIDGALRASARAADADEWEQVAADYAEAVGCREPSALLPAITADFADLTDRINGSTGTTRTRLLSSAAHMAALTAITLGTVRDHATAARWWRTATRAAAEVHDPALAAKVAGKRAVMALYSSPLERVTELADRAVEVGNAHATTGVLSGTAARTQALARLGRDDEALDSLRRLADLFDRHDGDATTGQWGWAEQRLRFVESEVHALGGRANDALSARDRAMLLYPSTSWAGPAQVEAHMSIAQIRAGNVRGGIAHMMATVARLEPWQRADAFVVRSARDVVGCIDDPRRQLEARTEVRALLESAR